MHAGNTHRSSRTAVALVLALVGTGLTAAPAAHAEAVFAIAPAKATPSGYFVIEARPGSVLRRTVKVTNVGKEAGTVRLYAADATTGSTTGAVYLGADRPRREVGAWIRLKTKRLRLGRRESRKVTFSVTVPKAARGGQHLGGLVADNAALKRGKSRKGGKGSFKIDVHHLTIAAVQVNLPAKPASGMRITGIRAGGKPGYQTVYLGLGSTGNRLIKPTLSVDVTNGNGKRVLGRTTKLDTFVPDTRISYPVPVLKQALAPGTYDGKAVLRLRGRVLARFSGSFEITKGQVKRIFGGKSALAAPDEGGPPWLWIAIGAGVLILLLGAIEHFRRKVRKLQRSTGEASPPGPGPPTDPSDPPAAREPLAATGTARRN